MLTRAKTISFWDAHAPWQQRWLAHCNYHQPILSLITARTSPGWRVLDIGAGTGVLALPLRDRGCQVTALEPSAGMRAVLRRAAGPEPFSGLTIDPRAWEEVAIEEARGYHLILACNSLHLTTLGLTSALRKAFLCQPEHVCLVCELDFLPSRLSRDVARYRLVWSGCISTDSSFAYRHPEEVWEHFQHRHGRSPQWAEKHKLLKALVYRDGHYWLPQMSLVSLFWWSKMTLH